MPRRLALLMRHLHHSVLLFTLLAACGGNERPPTSTADVVNVDDRGPSDPDVADGSARCSGGQIECERMCVDPSTNPTHCGGCGRTCPADRACMSGNCVAMPTDGSVPTDGTMPADAMPPVDASPPMDVTPPVDAPPPVDVRPPVDVTPPMDVSPPMDVASAA